MYKLFSSLTGKIMEDPKDGELVEKGKLSIPSGKSVDYLMEKWHGNADERQRKEDELDLVLLFISIAYSDYGATVADLKKLGMAELLELKNRILAGARVSLRKYRFWVVCTALSLVAWLPLSAYNSFLVFVYLVASFGNAFFLTIYSMVRDREDFGLKFLLLNNKLYGKGDEKIFPGDYKETFKYFEKTYGEHGRKYLDMNIRRP